MRLAGAVILYNPGLEVISNISTYLNALDKLYVIDNSEKYNNKIVSWVCEEKKCIYINLRRNHGVAYALNVAVLAAKQERYSWLLMMDQDTRLTADYLEVIKEYIVEKREEKVKLVCGTYKELLKKTGDKPTSSIQYITKTITSGSIIEIATCIQLKGFNVKLFIDEVDYEYCARLIISGYKIARLKDARFDHEVGKQIRHGKIYSYNYPPVRYYYLIRNLLYVYVKFRKTKAVQKDYACIPKVIYKWFRSVLYEKYKIRKYRAMILGAFDFVFGRMGKCRWKI